MAPGPVPRGARLDKQQAKLRRVRLTWMLDEKYVSHVPAHPLRRFQHRSPGRLEVRDEIGNDVWPTRASNVASHPYLLCIAKAFPIDNPSPYLRRDGAGGAERTGCGSGLSSSEVLRSTCHAVDHFSTGCGRQPPWERRRVPCSLESSFNFLKTQICRAFVSTSFGEAAVVFWTSFFLQTTRHAQNFPNKRPQVAGIHPQPFGYLACLGSITVRQFRRAPALSAKL